MNISIPCSATQARAHPSANHTEMPSIPSKFIFRNSTFLPSHTRTPFLYKTSCIVYNVLSVLAEINLGGQGMVITNQGVAIQPCFQQAKHMQFYKIGQWVVFIKTRTKHASKGGIELVVFEAFREVLVEVLSFGLGIAELVLVHLLAVLLVDGLSFVHTMIYDAYKQAHNQEKEIKALSLSSNRKQLRYGDRSNILGWFPNGMAKIGRAHV